MASPTYSITVQSSGVTLGDYSGETADDAVEAMARDAGYGSYRDMCSIAGPADLDAEVERQRADLIVNAI